MVKFLIETLITLKKMIMRLENYIYYIIKNHFLYCKSIYNDNN